ncbi:MAG: hypothetical protein ACI944_001450, partial [Natronomonas sp.]
PGSARWGRSGGICFSDPRNYRGAFDVDRVPQDHPCSGGGRFAG